jgi:hypothetical protein
MQNSKGCWIVDALWKPAGCTEVWELDSNAQGFDGAADSERLQRGWPGKKPWNWGRHEARLGEFLSERYGGSVSQMNCVTEGAAGMNTLRPKQKLIDPSYYPLS